jgi:hypothetical protein
MGVRTSGYARMIVFQSLDSVDHPDERLEHRFLFLRHRHAQRFRASRPPKRHDLQFRSTELGRTQEMANDARRSQELTLRSAGAKGKARYIPAVRSPDLPVGAQTPVVAITLPTDGGIGRKLSHSPLTGPQSGTSDCAPGTGTGRSGG